MICATLVCFSALIIIYLIIYPSQCSILSSISLLFSFLLFLSFSFSLIPVLPFSKHLALSPPTVTPSSQLPYRPNPCHPTGRSEQARILFSSRKLKRAPLPTLSRGPYPFIAPSLYPALELASLPPAIQALNTALQ